MGGVGVAGTVTISHSCLSGAVATLPQIEALLSILSGAGPGCLGASSKLNGSRNRGDRK